MSDANDTDNADVTGNKANDKSDSAGSDAGNTQNNQDDKKYSDKDFDDFVKRKTPELEARIKSKFEKSLEGKIIFDNQDAVDKLIKEAVEAAIKDKEKQVVRSRLQSEYNLTDKQIAKIEGEDEQGMRAEIEELFGKPKKEAPKLNPGGDNNKSTNNDNEDAIIAAALKAAVDNAGKR